MNFDDVIDRLSMLPPDAKIAGMTAEEAADVIASGEPAGKEIMSLLQQWGSTLPAESPKQKRYRMQRQGIKRAPRGTPRSQQ